VRGGPFTIVLLNRILAFAAGSAAEAVLGYGLVCGQWREAVVMFAHEMWQLLSNAKFGARLRGRTWSCYSYEQRARALRARQHPELLNEVESCELPQFRFRCPLIAANMRVTGELTASGQSILFCDLCNKQVHTVMTEQEIRGAPSEERRCILIPPETVMALRLARRERGASERKTIYNILILTTEPAPPPGPDASDSDLGIALLRQISKQVSGSSVFLFRETLLAEYEIARFHLHVVRVAPLPRGYSASNPQHVAAHPMSPGGALHDDAMPTLSGWNHCVVVTPEAQRIVATMPPGPARMKAVIASSYDDQASQRYFDALAAAQAGGGAAADASAPTTKSAEALRNEFLAARLSTVSDFMESNGFSMDEMGDEYVSFGGDGDHLMTDA